MKIKSIIQRAAIWQLSLPLLAVGILAMVTGCETTQSQVKPAQATSSIGTNDIVFREADVLKVVFPSDTKLNTTETIRRDGKITLPVIGEVVAAGKTPEELRKSLVDLYAKDLVSSRDISVTVMASSYPVYINGAVKSPGKVTADHRLTVLEAIMEAGGFDYDHANLKSVKVIRSENGQSHTYVVNLRGVMNGSKIEVFYTQPADIIFVPTRITWF